MKKVITTLMLCASTLANAEIIGLHLASVHDKPGFNDSNPGIYYVHNNGLTLGHFKNSEGNQSSYAGYTKMYDRISISAVIITGYKVGPVPTLIPSYTIPLGANIGLRTSLLYNPMKDGASALHWSIERKF